MLVLHLHPRAVPAEALRFSRTLGLGGAAALLFVVLVATGGLLLPAYSPSPEKAYASILALEDQRAFGSFVRALHHWAANGLILAAFLHLLRSFFTGAWDAGRRVNWVLGLGLLGLVAASNFTGYLLPWDQLAYWAVSIGTGMLDYVPLVGEALKGALRGGDEVGAPTLSTFFILHVALLPLSMLLLLAFHFWLVRKSGGVVLPRPAGGGEAVRTPVAVRPNLTYREGVAALVVLAALALLAAVAPPPLQEQANPGMSPNPAKAPWYFMGIQELLIHLDPLVAVFLLPLFVLAALAALPFFAGGEPHSGWWFHSDGGRRAVPAAAGAGALLAVLWVLAGTGGSPWKALTAAMPSLLGGGLLPLGLWAGLAAGTAWAARRRWGGSRIETIQVLFAFLTAAFIVLTLTGTFFRGTGMHLAWPWAPGATS
jgi:quinol-cytochrome oxidoreductase complex cytochrome b subunit